MDRKRRQYLQPIDLEDRVQRRQGENNWRACARRKRAHKTPLASRAPHIPIEAASKRQRPWLVTSH